MYTFPNLEPVSCSVSSSNCCFLACIQVSQETGKVVWYSDLFKNFPQFVVTHTVTGFNVVNEAEADVSLEFSCFFYDPMDIGNLASSGLLQQVSSLAYSKTSSSSILSFSWIIFSPFLDHCHQLILFP